MANNPYVNKVEDAAGNTIMDITDTTATSGDVISGEVFYTASGQRSTGSLSLANYVTGPSSATDAHVAAFDGTTGKAIKDSGYTIGKSVPENAVFTDTTYSDATTSASGLMSATDKTKLDGIATGATVNIVRTQIPNGSSLNDYNAEGYYWIADTAPNCTDVPTNPGYGIKLDVFYISSTNSGIQIWTDFQNGIPRTLMRRKYAGGAWGTWYEFAKVSQIPTAVSQLTNDSGYTTNVGTITGITMNGASKGTSGVVDLGTVITSHQDISGKKNTQTAKSDPTASGTSATFIATLSQDAQGVITATKKTVRTMSAASADAAGATGLVPAPAAGKQSSFLRGDATWATPTNTKNTAGTTNKTGTKMFLVGATEQSANPQTYSNSNCYVGTDNCLYSGGTKVLTSHQSLTSLTNRVTALEDKTGVYKTSVAELIAAVTSSTDKVTFIRAANTLMSALFGVNRQGMIQCFDFGTGYIEVIGWDTYAEMYGCSVQRSNGSISDKKKFNYTNL